MPRANALGALTSGALKRIRACDYSGHSDVDLRRSFDALRDRCRSEQVDDPIPEIFALVAEVIGRRLGAWRLFDPNFDKGPLNRYEELAGKVLASSPHRGRMDFYTDPGFLDSDAFGQSLCPLLDRMGLDGAERTLVTALVYVAEKGNVDYWPNVRLPAELYRAVRAKDADGLLRFDPTDEQLLAGLLLYHRSIVEMNAGEGKTVAAAFPAVVRALEGRSVHVMTANDYLAARDADWLAPAYESLGLTVGAVLGYMGDEDRRYAYRQQIVYGTLREFGFDFLRDNLKLPPDEPVQGSLEAAIVDEADLALIDQASTPLIISGEPIGNRRAFDRTRLAIEELVSLQAAKVRELEVHLREAWHEEKERGALLAKLYLSDPTSEYLRACFAAAPRAYRRAMAAVQDDEPSGADTRLASDLLYVVDARLKSVSLTELGQDLLHRRLDPIFEISELERRLELIEADDGLSLEETRQLTDQLSRRILRQSSQMSQAYQMLRACVLLKRDVDYLVSDGAILLLDELTGRTLPDHRYQQGLHAAIEAKEGLAVHREVDTLAQVSVQGLIKQYARVAGMTGTALGSRDELRREYGLPVEAIPPSQPSMRADLGTRLYLTRADKLATIVNEIDVCQRAGRPVLVGTLTVEQSAEISRLLTRQGIRHSLLNAVNSSEEAAIIRNAGAFGAVTIATNMAGRGTDIVLEPGVNDRIVAGYVGLVRELLAEGAARVELACATSEAAVALREALSDCDGLTATWGGRAGRPAVVAVAVSGSADPTAGDCISADFGLGLYVIGTEMNQSGRIDLQLRGRSGRQGAHGASRFILSLEDQLLAFRGDNASCMSGGARKDRSGRTFFEGPRLERHLAAVQAGLECDAEMRRAAAHEYARVLEAQTLAYYRARAEVVASGSFDADCRRFPGQWAERVVERHFPGFRLSDYEAQFDRLHEELWADLGIDCADLYGAGLDGLAEEIGDLMLDRMEQARAKLGDAGLDRLERLLFLQASDELWREHLGESHELALSISLTAPGHKAAVAEYVIRSSAAFERLKDRVVDTFLPRLLAFPTDGVTESKEEEAFQVQDLAKILV